MLILASPRCLPAAADDDVFARIIEPEEIGTEAMKRDVIHRMLAGAEWNSLSAPPTADFDFADALIAGNGLQFIEPTARSDRYDSPIFATWQRRCPGLEFNRYRDDVDWYDASGETYTIRGPKRGQTSEPKTLELIREIARDWRLEDYLADTGHLPTDILLGTRNFRLYELDLSSPPDGVEEILFLSDAPYSYWEHRGALGGVNEFSAEKDALRNWNEVMPPQDIPASARTPQSRMTLPSIIDLEACTVRTLVSVWLGTADRFDVEAMPMTAYGKLIWGWNVFAGPNEPPFPDGLVALVRWQNDEPVLLTLDAPFYSQKEATHHIYASAFKFSYVLELVPTWHEYGFSVPR